MGTLKVFGKSCAIVVSVAFCLLSVSMLNSPVMGSNSATHGGLAEDTLNNDFFIAGAMLADIDHFLPLGVPQTDSLAFTSGLIDRAKNGTNDLRFFAMGWLEHLDQDNEFVVSVVNIQAVYPSYTVTDIRLAFDYLTITQHPTYVNVTFINGYDEIVDAIAAGFTNISSSQVRTAIWDFVFSESAQNPGLNAQMRLAQLFAVLFPDKVANMASEYDSYYQRTTSGRHNPFLGYFYNRVMKSMISKMRSGNRPEPKSLAFRL
ncbi:MAG: hypothetical protein V3U51_03840 [Thermoplasmata archaeon]